jgi:hypothetical protein
VKRATLLLFVTIFIFCLVTSNIAATSMSTAVYAKKRPTGDSDKGSTSGSSSSGDTGGDSNGGGGSDTGTDDTTAGNGGNKDTNTDVLPDGNNNINTGDF